MGKNIEDVSTIKHGIYRILNLISGKCYFLVSEIDGEQSSKHKYLLDTHRHPSKELQDDWDNTREEYFQFALIEIIDDGSKLEERKLFYEKVNKIYN